MIIEPDQHYYENGKYVWTPEKRAAAWEKCFTVLEQEATSGKFKKIVMLIGIPGAGKSTYTKAHDSESTIIFDGVFVNPKERERAITIAHSTGLPIEGVWLNTPLEICLERNAQRTDDRKVREDHVTMMYENLQKNKPRLEEGYTTFIEQ
ncbi:MAG: AAA family ATPase [Patescibacteria group bacterium]